MEYDSADDILPLFWNTIGKAFIPAVLPWIIYIVFIHKKLKQDMYGKVVLITGASSGLGEQLAHVFYSKGCKVILAARRLDQLERVKNDLLALNPKVTTYTPEIIQLDLTDLSSIPKKATEALAICGQIDILINNGGISYRGDILSTSIDVDMKVMMVNYFGTIALTKAVLPSMIRKKNGQIVSISSVQGRIAIPYRSAYGASKHALQAFMDCLRAEVKSKGITVTVINPGYIKTNLSVNAITGSGQRYGVMDDTTSGGYDATRVAEKIFYSILREDKEFTIAPIAPKVAIMLRALCSPLFFFIMSRRAKRESSA